MIEIGNIIKYVIINNIYIKINCNINVCKYYELFGVKTTFQNGKLIIKKRNNFNYPEKIIIDLKDNPDLAQTIIVTAFGLNIPTKLTGLSTLKVKETDRIEALRNELTNLGASCIIHDESILRISINDRIIDTTNNNEYPS